MLEVVTQLKPNNGMFSPSQTSTFYCKYEGFKGVEVDFSCYDNFCHLVNFNAFFRHVVNPGVSKCVYDFYLLFKQIWGDMARKSEVLVSIRDISVPYWLSKLVFFIYCVTNIG